MSTLQLILIVIAILGGIVLCFLRRYVSLSARIEKWGKERDEVDKKLKQAVLAGNGDLVNKLNAERLSISKALDRLYSRRRKSILYRR